MKLYFMGKSIYFMLFFKQNLINLLVSYKYIPILESMFNIQIVYNEEFNLYPK